MFTDTETASILSDFPKFELSYETMTHKKVFNHNVILAIPDGKKCLAWFTTYKAENVCFIMETSDNNRIENIYISKTGFNDNLVLGDSGTILYGTVFRPFNSASCFCIEDLYYYKGANYLGCTFLSRLQLLKTILKNELSQNALTYSYMVFGLPLMNPDLLTLLKEIDLLPYKIKYLKYGIILFLWIGFVMILTREAFPETNWGINVFLFSLTGIWLEDYLNKK
jgi:hypothetical protein